MAPPEASDRDGLRNGEDIDGDGNGDRVADALTRRGFLGAAGAAGLATYGVSSARAAGGPPGQKSPPPGLPCPYSFSTWVRRREDFLSLRFDFYNLVLDTSTHPPRLVRKAGGLPAIFAVVFWPQNVAEQAFLETSALDKPQPPLGGGTEALENPGDVNARIAGESRLAFEVPKGATVPYTLPDLLQWAAFAQHVVPAARTPARQAPNGLQPSRALREPNDCDTFIELPWRLLLSPSERGGWAHALTPVEHGGRFELWHTRLGVRDVESQTVDEENASQRKVRAIWALDPAFKQNLKHDIVPPDDPSNPEPFRMSLTERDRYDIVRASADVGIAGYAPLPVDVRRLMLTSMGAWIDSRGAWDTPPEITLEEWVQRGTLGRDHYARIVRKGHLFPFGHRASLIKVTERKFDVSKNGKRGAYLRQRFFIVVREPLKQFGDDAFRIRNEGRRFAFESVRVTTLVTPNLEAPSTYVSGITPVDTFQPTLDGKPFPFHMVGEDWAGRRVEFTTPVVFVSTLVGFAAGDAGAVIDAYEAGATTPPGRVEGKLAGQSVAIAPSDEPGDTSVEVATMRFGAERPLTTLVIPGDPDPFEEHDQPRFFPTMFESDVRLGAVEQASGGDAKTTLKYLESYVTGGFGAGGVFAELPAPPKLEFPSDKSGGIATPNINISGLSKTLGPVGGPLDTIAAGHFKPADFFQGIEAKLFGAVDLIDIVLEIADLAGAAAPGAPKLTYRTLPDRLETKLSWEADLSHDPARIFVPHGSKLKLDATVVTHLSNPQESTFTVVGDIRNFDINLIGDSGGIHFITIPCNRLAFTSEKGQKAKVDVAVGEVEFFGVLEFVKQLSDLMGIGSDGAGPGIDIAPEGITATFAVPIPSINVGVFSLSNLSFSAGLNIPFSGNPIRFRFAFADPSDPFLIAVSMFGGGGSLVVYIGPDGVERIEGTFEFGATISIDLGVASGGVELMAGIYFSFGENDDGDETTTLEGYVRLSGELCIIGLISLSLVFEMSLTYTQITQGGKEFEKVIGQATLTVTVEVLLFSADVSVTAEKKFGNAPNDPTFAQLMTQSDWETYCDAFDDVAVAA